MRKLFLLALSLLIIPAAIAQSSRRTPAKKEPPALDYRHAIAFTPFSGIVAFNEINPGIGFDYEYIISQEHGIGIHFPVAFGYAGPEQDFYNEYKHTSAYAAPGIRFHTGNRYKSVDFATGPSVLIGNMHFKRDDQFTGWPGARESYDLRMMGFVVDNSLNFNRRNFQFGFDVRIGTLMEQEDQSKFFIHFGMHFGGLF